MPKRLVFWGLASLGIRFFEPGGQGFESLRAHFLSKKFFGRPDHEIGNEQIEPLTDNKMVRLPGAAPGRTSPRQRRRSGAKRRTSGAAASNPSGPLKAPNTRLDRQLRRASYIAIRQLSNVRAAPQVTTLKALLLPTPRCLFQATVFTLLDSAQPSCQIFARASIYEPCDREFQPSTRPVGPLLRLDRVRIPAKWTVIPGARGRRREFLGGRHRFRSSVHDQWVG